MSEAPLAGPSASDLESVSRPNPGLPTPLFGRAGEAAEWMSTWGESEAGATSEVAVSAAEAVALVCSDITVGRAELRELVDYAASDPAIRRCYLFNDRPYGSRVVSMANEWQVALFWWNERGHLQPAGELAERCVSGGLLTEPTGGRAAVEPAADPMVDDGADADWAPNTSEIPVVSAELAALSDSDPQARAGWTLHRDESYDEYDDNYDVGWGPWTHYEPAPEETTAATSDGDPVAESTEVVVAAEVPDPEPTAGPPVPAEMPAPPVAPVAPVPAQAPAAVQDSPGGDPQIDRYLSLLHNRASAHGVGGSSRRAKLPEERADVPPPTQAPRQTALPRRFADPTRQVAGGPDQAARSAASRPSGPIDGITPEMIFPTQSEKPGQEAGGQPADETGGKGQRRGWFARRAAKAEAEDALVRAVPVQRSYQMKRTLEARRVLLETGLTPVTEVPEAMEWLRQGDRARAIAIYRKTVGVGLVEAIDALDALGNDY